MTAPPLGPALGRRRGWRLGVVAMLGGLPFAFLVAFALYPLAQQAAGSFFRWHMLRPSMFVALGNYRQVIDDPIARAAARHSIVYVAVTVPLEVALGTAGAWMTLRVRRLGALVATALVLPLVVPWPAASTLFLGLFANQGMVNRLAGHILGGAGTAWLQQVGTSFGVIVLMGVWKGVPWCYLLLLGAFGACPKDVLEAARVDGARGRTFWWRVLLPSVRPMLVFVCVFRILVEAQTFTSVSLLTQGGPMNGTELTSLRQLSAGLPGL